MTATLIWDDADAGDSEVVLSGKRLFDAVRMRILRLDGASHTLVTIIRDDGHMAVGGGSEGYIVYATYDNETFHQLLNTAAGEEDVQMVAGGQPGMYARRNLVDTPSAIRAAEVFAQTGGLADGLTWVAA